MERRPTKSPFLFRGVGSEGKNKKLNGKTLKRLNRTWGMGAVKSFQGKGKDKGACVAPVLPYVTFAGATNDTSTPITTERSAVFFCFFLLGDGTVQIYKIFNYI